MLHERHPDLFWRAVAYEEKHQDGRFYTWSERETLRELIARKDEIIAKHEKSMERQKSQQAKQQSLADILADVLDDDDDTLPCLACHL